MLSVKIGGETDNLAGITLSLTLLYFVHRLQNFMIGSKTYVISMAATKLGAHLVLPLARKQVFIIIINILSKFACLCHLKFL